ncbi:DUF2187 family protein [Jeotgalicoccus huakuii]|uniref:DUF2187 family protein n=1 Tax=Jeotgalicoccus TaxID=227979 RepID=UPI00041D560C|nr:MULTISPECIES: DUF2187 family protein [Jeotgalicoccus]MCK1976506.1 DUF2187 family protein [Jeotgalicoccus huakuii]QQD85887.1 DUF2187 family protein [Jeotgalicoccus sp. ATCC 8456]
MDAKKKDKEELDVKVGNIVKFDGMLGKVEKINDNSVIVDITINDNFDEHEMFEKTVVNHRRYEIVDDTTA